MWRQGWHVGSKRRKQKQKANTFWFLLKTLQSLSQCHDFKGGKRKSRVLGRSGGLIIKQGQVLKPQSWSKQFTNNFFLIDRIMLVFNPPDFTWSINSYCLVLSAVLGNHPLSWYNCVNQLNKPCSVLGGREELSVELQDPMANLVRIIES